jgi:hypothetical protein
LTSKEKEKEIKFTPNYKANEPIFWRVFRELANDNNGLISYDKLQERLRSTGNLDAGESVLMIEHMEKNGKIEKTKEYNVYKTGKPGPSTKETEEEELDNMRESPSAKWTLFNIDFSIIRIQTRASC